MDALTPSVSSGHQPDISATLRNPKRWEDLHAFIDTKARLLPVGEQGAFVSLWAQRLARFLHGHHHAGESDAHVPVEDPQRPSRSHAGPFAFRSFGAKDETVLSSLKEEDTTAGGLISLSAPVIVKRGRGRPRKDSILRNEEGPASNQITSYFARSGETPSPTGANNVNDLA